VNMRCYWKSKRSKSMKMKRESDDKTIMFDLLFSLAPFGTLRYA
jgi:hypothetical protein